MDMTDKTIFGNLRHSCDSVSTISPELCTSLLLSMALCRRMKNEASSTRPCTVAHVQPNPNSLTQC
jgi:hypothetical protein